MRYVIRFVPSLGIPDKTVEATDYVKTEEDVLFHNEHRPFYRVGKQYVLSVEAMPTKNEQIAAAQRAGLAE